MEAADAIHKGIAPGRELYRIARHVFIFNKETGENGEGSSQALSLGVLFVNKHSVSIILLGTQPWRARHPRGINIYLNKETSESGE